MRFLVLIPAYNEAGRVSKVVEKLKAKDYSVVVIDDGSNDATAEKAREHGAHVISLPKNQGKGAAIREGFAYFLKHKYDAAILMDADGQHKISDLSHFAEALAAEDVDMAVGNRMHSPQGMPWIRRATNRSMSWIISLIAGQKVPDSQCGFRALKRHVIENIKLETNRFEIESEMILKAARMGFQIRSIPVSSVYAGEGSHIHPLRDTLRFFKFLFRHLLTS